MICDLRVLRSQVGYSQVRLAQESGVSLPTIQNIEAKKANPTIDILEKIFLALGLKLTIAVPIFDVDLAIALGVPLSGEGVNLKKANKLSLAKESRRWIHLFSTNQLNERESEALAAFLMAIHDHYATFYTHALSCPIFDQKIKAGRKNPRHIKLRRMALAQVSRYL